MLNQILEEDIRIKQENFVQGGYYHFYNRSIENELLFRENDDYEYLLRYFKRIITGFPTSVFAYCLMPNHFHFLLRQDSDEAINKIFNSLFSSYVQRYNKKYQRRGKLLGHKLQHKSVDDENYLIYLCQYIHFNPVKACLVAQPEEWIYSNYREWIGLRDGTLFCREILENHFNDPQLYKDVILEHKKYLKDKKFIEILIDIDEN